MALCKYGFMYGVKYGFISSPPKFKREVQEYPFDLAKKNFIYKSYPYGWKVFEGNQIQAPLGNY